MWKKCTQSDGRIVKCEKFLGASSATSFLLMLQNQKVFSVTNYSHMNISSAWNMTPKTSQFPATILVCAPAAAAH